MWSCTTAAPYPEDPEELRELLVEHWTSPVRFRETIEALYADGARIFVEVGPRGNMTAFIEDTLRGRPCCAVASDVRRRSGVTQLNHLAGMLAVHDADVDVARLFAHRAVREVDWRSPAGPSAEDPAGVRIPLATGWPMLKLSDAALDRLGMGRPAAAPAGNGNGHGTGAANGNGNGAAAPMAPMAPVAQMPAPAAVPEPVTAWAPALALDGDEIDAAVTDHLQTMDRFLEAGADVMQAYLTAAVPAPAVEAPARPLVGTITACEPGSALVARRVVDPADDRYLLRPHARPTPCRAPIRSSPRSR